MEQNQMSPLERIDVMGGVLDKLADAHGRIKCGYICVLSEYLDALKKEFLIMSEKLKDAEQNNQNGIEISDIEIVPDTENETMSTN